MTLTTETIPSSVTQAGITTPAPADNLSVAAAEARAALRTRYLAKRAAQSTETRHLAEQAHTAWLGQERERWISAWIARNAPAPAPERSDDLSDADILRISFDKDTRIEKLITTGMWSQALLCFVYRHGCRVPLAEVRSWLESHGFGSTAGDEAIVSNRVIQTKGSPAFRKLIRDSGLDVCQGHLLFAVRYIGRYAEIPVLANDPAFVDQYPPDEY
jgi:hypothetical protein